MKPTTPSLVIFDLDGTLVQSTNVDDRCFIRAVQDTFGINVISNDWETYKYQTDAGLVLEISGKHGVGVASSDTLQQVQHRFLQLLEQDALRSDFELGEIRGARALLHFLHRNTNWAVAIATGGWEQSARFKLNLAEVNVDEFPLASSDDHVARENIIQRAIDRSEERYQGTTFSRIVYVGDGSWDEVAARNLCIGFIRVGEPAPLYRRYIVQDFSHPEQFVGLLESMRPPVAGPQPILRLVELPHDIETCRELFLEYANSLGFDLGFQNFDTELATLPGDYALPAGRLLLAFRDSRPAGCVALRRRGDDICEMKRLWVRPGFRGMGLGRQLAQAIVEEGRCAGYHAMRLDTVPSMGSAIAIYRTLGFQEITPYCTNPVSGAMFMQLDLKG